ncbi:MAG: YkvA family protein [Pseudomonadota bacterium]
MRISFDLSDNDLKHFRLIMQQAQTACRDMGEAQIIAAARQTLNDVRSGDVPDFIRARIEQLEPLVGMLTDTDWGLPDTERQHVLQALTYFSDKDDLIPDDIPGVGFLDDAIMIELVVAELGEELDSYRDFCQFRDDAKSRGDDAERSDWLRARRQELQTRAGKKRRRGPLGLF